MTKNCSLCRHTLKWIENVYYFTNLAVQSWRLVSLPVIQADPASIPLPQSRQSSDPASNPLPQSRSVNLVKCSILVATIKKKHYYWSTLILIKLNFMTLILITSILMTAVVMTSIFKTSIDWVQLWWLQFWWL